MVDNTLDGKRLWDIIYKLVAAQYTKFHTEPENKDAARVNPRENASGQVYTIVADLKEAGYPIEVPPDVLSIFEPPQIVEATAEARGVIETVIGAPKVILKTTWGTAKGILHKLSDTLKITAPANKPEEKPQEG